VLERRGYCGIWVEHHEDRHIVHWREA
jgi:hypothetical protein